jgi:nucleoporin NUP42
MTLCKFYQQGYCKFGNSCRFEHPAGGNRNQNQNQPARSFGNAGGGNNQQLQGLDKYNITLETLEKDLTTERPLWILSSYAPGKGAPKQLFGGYPCEQSFEELRMHYLTGKAAGNEQQTVCPAPSPPGPQANS